MTNQVVLIGRINKDIEKIKMNDNILIIFNTQDKPYEKKIPRIEVLESSLLVKDALPSELKWFLTS